MAAELPRTGQGQSRAEQEVPDLQTQLESLLHQVWCCEAASRLHDRIDFALGFRRPVGS